MKKILKRTGQVVVTSLMLGIYSMGIATPGMNQMAQHDGDFNDTAIVQEVEKENGVMAFIGDIFSIPSASASYTPSSTQIDKNSAMYKGMKAHIATATVKLYQKLEKKQNPKQIVTTLTSLKTKINLLSKNSKYQSQKYKILFLVLDEDLTLNIQKYKNLADKGSSNLQSPVKIKPGTSITPEKTEPEKTTPEKTTPSGNEDTAMKGFKASGGQVIGTNFMKLDYNKINNNIPYIKKTYFNGKDYGKININDMTLPGELIFGVDKKEVQKITQKNNGGTTSLNMGDLGVVGNFKINGVSYNAQFGNEGAIDSIKYHFLINGELQRGTQKYEDFKQEMLKEKVFGGDTGKSFFVKLEKLPLGNSIQNKLDSGQRMTEAEITLAIETAIKLDGIDNQFTIRKCRDGGERGTGLFKKGSDTPSYFWSQDGGKLPGSAGYKTAGFVNPDRGIVNYLFSR